MISAASVSSFGFGGTNGHVLLARPAASKAGAEGCSLARGREGAVVGLTGLLLRNLN